MGKRHEPARRSAASATGGAAFATGRAERTRRDFLRDAAAFAGAALVPGSVGDSAGLPFGPPVQRGRPGADTAAKVTPWVLDVDGNGTVNADDRRAIEAGLGGSRGFAVAPRVGYDFRADLAAGGSVTMKDLRLFEQEAVLGPVPPRPITICWHYGWYHPQRRILEPTTATYLGGDYDSNDPVVEEQFHRLKNEFGITADLLSWIDEPPGLFPTPLANYESGYFAAPSVATRRFGWLYETSINLRSSAPMTLSASSGRRERLVEHFRRMAAAMVDPITRQPLANVLRVDGRPVVYMFASHLLGTNVASLIDVAISLGEARRAFIEVAGVPPYLIGDEALFPDDATINQGRRFRAAFFDAIARYHHYNDRVVGEFAAAGSVHLGGDYLDFAVDLERRTIDAFAGLANRYTGAPVLVIPSSAAGFAKLGFPTLLATRMDYGALLRAMQQVTDEHLTKAHADRLGTPALPAPLVIVGSWNEEFEGHALFPNRRNDAAQRGRFGGFEWLLAIKELYGWNHTARR